MRTVEEEVEVLIGELKRLERMIQEMKTREHTVIVNWPGAVVVVAVLLMISFGVWMYLWNSHWTSLFGQVKEGCANPDNHYAQISIVLSHDQVWNCTPFYKKGTAPKSAKQNQQEVTSGR